jgi:hypothetical protein
MQTENEKHLLSENTCVIIEPGTELQVFLQGMRQSLLMEISNDQREYNNRRAAKFLLLANLERYLGIRR